MVTANLKGLDIEAIDPRSAEAVGAPGDMIEKAIREGCMLGLVKPDVPGVTLAAVCVLPKDYRLG